MPSRDRRVSGWRLAFGTALASAVLVNLAHIAVAISMLNLSWVKWLSA